MYLRHTTICKNGKTHKYWRLVRSVRVGRKVRQETVAQLGELDAEGRVAARHLAESIVGVQRQPGLFDEDIPWDVMAAVLVIARLCEPSSELHIAEDWFRRTALDDLLGLPEEKVNDDRLYRALDPLLTHKDALEKHLQQRLGTLFKLEYIVGTPKSQLKQFEAKLSGEWPQIRDGLEVQTVPGESGAETFILCRLPHPKGQSETAARLASDD